MLKQWILYSACSDWLLKVGISIAIHWFTLQLLRASDAKLAKKVTKFCLKALTGKTLSVLLEFIDGTSGKDFCILYFTCSKMSLKLNLTVFKWMVLSTKRIHNSFWRKFPTIAKKKCLSVLLDHKKTRRPFGHLRAKIVIVGSSYWVENHDFCAQLSHCFRID